MPLLLSLALPAFATVGCRPAPAPRSPAPAPAPQVERQRQQRLLALRQCQQRRQELLAGLAELRRAEAALAQQRAFAPAPPPQPPVWDEAREQRYSLQDQQLDRQRYEQELAVWRQRRTSQSLAWRAQRDREAQAQERLNRQWRQLRQRYPDLFSGPDSIEVKPQELERLSRCPAPSA